jgi:hypothetical protein
MLASPPVTKFILFRYLSHEYRMINIIVSKWLFTGTSMNIAHTNAIVCNFKPTPLKPLPAFLQRGMNTKVRLCTGEE